MTEVNEMSNNSKQKFVSDMKSVVADAEEILRATAGVAGEKMADLRERGGERLRDAKLRIADAEALLVDKTKAAAASRPPMATRSGTRAGSKKLRALRHPCEWATPMNE